MKQQIVVIHGGSTFDSYKDYLSYLKEKKITLDRLVYSRDWKDNLAQDLGESYQVLKPRMPNGSNSIYSEWKLWFKRISSLFAKDTILIGHSLGGIFLAKFLSQEKVGKKIKAVILVSAPFDDESEESLTEFKITNSLKKLTEQVGDIYLVQSEDDPIVSVAEVQKYKKILPDAKLIILPSGGHFNEESFPEMVKLIKSL